MRLVLIFVLCALAICGGCRNSPSSGPQVRVHAPLRPARINHVVFFKLKNSADAAELIADCDAKLASIPGVVSYYAGRHIDTGRATVDANYDVGFFVGFMTAAEYAGYVQHPDHIAAVEKWRPRWEWIRIYDVLDETP